MRATLATPVSADNHRMIPPVDAPLAEAALNEVLVATSRRARRGVRTQRTIQKEKDIGEGRCRPWKDVVQLLFSGQDNEVDINYLEQPAYMLIGLLRTRAGVAPSDSLPRINRHEGDIDCRLDAYQLAIQDGECSTENLRVAAELATKQIEALIALRDKLNERLLARGPRMVAL